MIKRSVCEWRGNKSIQIKRAAKLVLLESGDQQSGSGQWGCELLCDNGSK